MPFLNRFKGPAALAEAARTAALRLPATLTIALFAACAGVVFVEDGAIQSVAGRALLVAAIGIPSLLAIELALERRLAVRWGAVALAAAALGALFVGFTVWTEYGVAAHALQLALVAHLAVALAPFFSARGRPRPADFWSFNWRLLQRFALAVLFSGVVYLGLVLALAALDQLFGVDIDGERFGQLFFAVAFLLTTWIVLAGAPRADGSEPAAERPRALDVFARFVLLPLVGLYLLILVAYLARILITREWPSGWIGWLVSGVAVAGVLAHLLLDPVRERADSVWLLGAVRGFYLALVPALAMLLVAVGKRVSQYGLTEERAALGILALWLIGVALFFILRPRGPLALIPASLLGVAAVFAFGPWSIYDLSQRSQRQRGTDLLTRHGVLVDGALRRIDGEVPYEDAREISAVFRYLLVHHGERALTPWLEGSTIELPPIEHDARRSWQANQRALEVVEALGFRYVGPYESSPQSTAAFGYNVDYAAFPMDIAGYRRGIAFNYLQNAELAIDGSAYRLELPADTGNPRLRLIRDGLLLIEMPLGPFLERLRDEHGQAPPEPLSSSILRIEAENDAVAAAVYFRHLNGTWTDDVVTLHGSSGEIFFAERDR